MNTLTLITFAHYLGMAIVLEILSCILPSTIVDYYAFFGKVVIFIVLSRLTFEVAKRSYLQEKVDPLNKAVLITGCDSGFGHYLAKRLDSKGFQVFACCLFPSGDGAAALQDSCSKKLHTLGLDVTDEDSINKAFIYVKENLGTSKLWAIVNNAGIYKGTDAELSCIEDYKDTMEVNAFGPVRITKAFLPLLRQSRGRIVNVTSIAGRLFLPHSTPYAMSKHAAATFNDCLKQEVEMWGIKVISVEPEIYKTQLSNSEIIGSQIKSAFQKLSESVKDDYGEGYMESLKQYTEDFFRNSSSKIYLVVEDLESAIILKNVDCIYRPRRNFMYMLIIYAGENLPKSVVEITMKIHSILYGLRKPNNIEKYVKL